MRHLVSHSIYKVSTLERNFPASKYIRILFEFENIPQEAKTPQILPNSIINALFSATPAMVRENII